MAIKIIRNPSTSFRIECEDCEAIFEYGFPDLDKGAIQCPCCKGWNDHCNRLKMPKESEVAKRREDIEKSPVDCSTPSVTDSKGDTE